MHTVWDSPGLKEAMLNRQKKQKMEWKTGALKENSSVFHFYITDHDGYKPWFNSAILNIVSPQKTKCLMIFFQFSGIRRQEAWQEGNDNFSRSFKEKKFQNQESDEPRK